MLQLQLRPADKILCKLTNEEKLGVHSRAKIIGLRKLAGPEQLATEFMRTMLLIMQKSIYICLGGLAEAIAL